MADALSLTTSKELVEKLKPLICCSESLDTCRDDEFCSSDPAEWPTIKTNGTPMVRLAYPTDKNSIPGIDYFSSAYMDWSIRTGCGALVADIATLIADSGHTHPTAQEDELKGKIQKKLSRGCDIMYDDENGVKVFNPKRAEDLQNIAGFSVKVQQTRKTEFDWRTFSKGGGVLGIGLLILWLIYKGLQLLRKGGDRLRDAGRFIGAINEGLDLISRGTSHFFGITLPGIGRTTKYVVTFGWLRGKKPPVDVDEEEGIEGRKVSVHNPHPEVVMTQFASLTKSKHFWELGRRFAELSDVGKEYLVHLAIQQWHKETRRSQKNYMEKDPRLTEGKMPIQFLLWFADMYLGKQPMLAIIEDSARVWARREAEDSAGDPAKFSPKPPAVSRQLSELHDPRYMEAHPDVQNYIVRMAIAQWTNTPVEMQRIFISRDDVPSDGVLPQTFVKFFSETEFPDIDDIKMRVELYREIGRYLGDSRTYPFHIVDNRLSQITRAWEAAPTTVREGFQALPDTAGEGAKRALPRAFAEYMFKTFKISVEARGTAKAVSEHWTFEKAKPEKYRGFDLRNVMQKLSILNDVFRFYPDLLRRRAMSIVEGWLLLPKSVRSEFVLLTSASHKIDSKSIPMAFVAFWHAANPGIGINSRKPVLHTVRPDDDDGSSSGTGGSNASPAGTANAPPTTTDGGMEMSAMPAASAANAQAAMISAKARASTLPSPSHFAAIRRRMGLSSIGTAVQNHIINPFVMPNAMTPAMSSAAIMVGRMSALVH